MSDPISLALGTKQFLSIIGLLIGGNVISFKYIIGGKLKQIDNLSERVKKVEQHRWAELNKMGAEFQVELDKQYQLQQQMNGRIDEIYKLLSVINNKG